MEPKAKRIKFAEPEGINFLDLNDDCIFVILNKLSPSDLCSMHFTCEKLQELILNYVQLKYQHKCITIDASCYLNIQFVLPKEEKFLKYFSKSIRHVRVVSYRKYYENQMEHVFEFVKTQCCEQLKSLVLNVRGRYDPIHGELIKNQLLHLKSLSILNPHSRSELYTALMVYCKNLEHFAIETEFGGDAFWLLHKYPKLKSIQIDIQDEAYCQQFELLGKKFITRNPQLKDITCSQNGIMRTILRNVINIERLVLKFDFVERCDHIVDDLKIWCAKGPIKWLEIDMTRIKENVQRDTLKMLNDSCSTYPIHSLHFQFCDNFEPPTLFEKLKSLVRLEMELIKFPPCAVNGLVKILSKKLHNLEELTLTIKLNKTLDFKDVVIELVRSSSKLKKIMFKSGHPSLFRFRSNDLIELNKIRLSHFRDAPMLIKIDFKRIYEYDIVRKLIYPSNRIVNLELTALDGSFKY